MARRLFTTFGTGHVHGLPNSQECCWGSYIETSYNSDLYTVIIHVTTYVLRNEKVKGQKRTSTRQVWSMSRDAHTLFLV